MRKSILSFLLTVLVATAAQAYVAVVNKADYNEVHILPAPKDVKIDGNLAEWPTGGELYLFPDESMAEKFSVKGRMLYDADNLYIGGVIRDPTPLMNRYTSGSDYKESWNADSIQVRLIVDPTIPKPYPTGDQRNNAGPRLWARKLAHMTLWYSTLEQKPCFYASFGMTYSDGRLNPEGMQAAYKMGDDGKSYTFEYKIPWSALTFDGSPHPQAGDATAAQWQIHWGDDEGRAVSRGMSDVRMKGSASLGYMAPGECGKALFEKTAEVQATVNAAVSDTVPAGHLPITVDVPGEGPKKISIGLWSAEGKLVRTLCGALPVQAGKVTVNWDGLDDFFQPVPAGTYEARGLVHDGITTHFIASVNNSGQPPYQTSDGRGGWGGDYSPPVSVCSDTQRVYVLWPSGEASTTHIATDFEGRKLWGANGNSALGNGMAWCLRGDYLYQLGVRGVLKMQAKDGLHTAFSSGKSSIPLPLSWARRGIVADDTSIYVTQHGLYDKGVTSNAVLVMDRASGDLRRTIPMAFGPFGLALAPDGRLYVAGRTETDGLVVKLDPATGKTEPFLKGLDEPYNLCVDTDNNLYVSLQSNCMQVAKYSPQGKRLMTYGKKGGRPELGAYDPAGMLKPRGVSVDPAGRLWVAEDDSFPRRLSVWNTDGTLWKEFFGAARYSAFVYGDAERPWLIEEAAFRWKVDLTNGTVTPHSTVYRKGPFPKDRNNTGEEFGWGQFIRRDGRTYICAKGNSGTLRIMEEVDGVYKLRLALRGVGGIFIDQNGDGELQDAELSTNRVIKLAKWAMLPGANLDLYWPATNGFFRLPLKAIQPNGSLVYADNPVLTKCESWPVKQPAMTVDEKGNVFALSYDGRDIQRGEPVRGQNHYLGKWSPDGKCLWKYNNAWTYFAWNSSVYKPGQLLGYVSFCGRPGKYVGITGYYGMYYLLDSETGLFVDALCQDQRSDYVMGPNIVHTETFNGFLYQPRGFEDYHFLGGDADGRIWRLDGMKSLRPFSQRLTLGEAEVLKARDAALQQRAATVASQITPLDVFPVDTRKPLVLDGKANDWRPVTDGRPGARITADGSRGAAVYAQYDNTNLYLLYRVQDANPFRNAVKNFQQLFKTGSSVEFSFQADPTADPKRKKPAKGDVRILFAFTHEGKPLATLYRPVSDDKSHAAHFESPTGKDDFDEVRALTDIPLALGADKGGYAVELALPWKWLGVSPKKGDVYRGDFGVIYGDPGGMRNAIKYMWADQSPEVSINNDVPSEVRLHPAQWGQLRFE